MEKSMDQWNNELEQLFGQYKRLAPDPEPSSNFTPELWRKIEARQSLVVRIRRLTKVFVAAAAAICMVFALFLAVPASDSSILNGNYVDLLAETHPAENLAPLGIRTDTE
jgi:hypothetical protein